MDMYFKMYHRVQKTRHMKMYSPLVMHSPLVIEHFQDVKCCWRETSTMPRLKYNGRVRACNKMVGGGGQQCVSHHCSQREIPLRWWTIRIRVGMHSIQALDFENYVLKAGATTLLGKPLIVGLHHDLARHTVHVRAGLSIIE